MEEKSFLDEGYDFIEESCSEVPLVYSEVEDIQEADVKHDSPYTILGRCSGNFQPINIPSRNNRIYESDHWMIQLAKPEVQQRLQSRGMWGTLGHFDRKITDEDIREGRVSHIITKLEVREDHEGNPFLYGELEILDTPAGRILEGMYKGGASLFVSSRGAGKLIPILNDPNGLKRVDKNSFYFEGFDIVRAAGFPKAKPVYEGVTESKETIKESTSEVAQTSSAPITTSDARITVAPVITSVANESEVNELKGQVEKLAKIIEKVVDDVYEVEESQTPEPAIEPQPEQPQISEAMEDFLKLLAETNITDEAVSDIFDIMFNKKEENK